MFPSWQAVEGDRFDEMARFHDGPLGRCPECGARVFLPCVACRCKLVAVNSTTRSNRESAFNLEGSSLQLKPDHHHRYETVRRNRRGLGEGL